MRYLQQAGQAVQFKIALSQDLAACIGEGGHMDAAGTAQNCPARRYVIDLGPNG